MRSVKLFRILCAAPTKMLLYIIFDPVLKNNKIAQYHKMLIGHQKILNAP